MAAVSLGGDVERDAFEDPLYFGDPGFFACAEVEIAEVVELVVGEVFVGEPDVLELDAAVVGARGSWGVRGVAGLVMRGCSSRSLKMRSAAAMAAWRMLNLSESSMMGRKKRWAYWIKATRDAEGDGAEDAGGGLRRQGAGRWRGRPCQRTNAMAREERNSTMG